MPDTPYTVSVLPVYPAREGKRQSENGKTCKLLQYMYCWTAAKLRQLATNNHCDAPSTFERSGQHEGDQPDHHHPHRDLESCRRQRSGLQSDLRSCRWRTGDCGKVLGLLRLFHRNISNKTADCKNPRKREKLIYLHLYDKGSHAD